MAKKQTVAESHSVDAFLASIDRESDASGVKARAAYRQLALAVAGGADLVAFGSAQVAATLEAAGKTASNLREDIERVRAFVQLEKLHAQREQLEASMVAAQRRADEVAAREGKVIEEATARCAAVMAEAHRAQLAFISASGAGLQVRQLWLEFLDPADRAILQTLETVRDGLSHQVLAARGEVARMRQQEQAWLKPDPDDAAWPWPWPKSDVNAAKRVAGEWRESADKLEAQLRRGEAALVEAERQARDFMALLRGQAAARPPSALLGPH